MKHSRIASVVLASLALGCVQGAPAAPQPAQPAPPAAEAEAPIEIVSPAEPLPVAAVVRAGSFARSHASPAGVSTRFARVLASARVFSAVLDAPGAAPSWELQVTAADYGEPNAYTFELNVLVLKGKEFVSSYASKQSKRTTAKTQLTVGPEQLGELAERAIRDVVRQIAADTERLSKL